MKKKIMVTLGLLSSAYIGTKVHAENIGDSIYGENIPAGQEWEYAFLETETLVDAYKDLTNEQANSLKIELEASGYTTVVVKSYKVKTGEIVESILKTFANVDLANDYINELKEKGIVVENIQFIYDTKEETSCLENTYNTLEAAQNALADFKAEYNENITEEIKENKTNTVLETINGTTAYNTFDAAQNALAEFLNNESNETTQFYFTGEVVGPKGTGEYTSSNINETFESSEKALEYLAKLEEEGYHIISYTFTKDTKKESNNLENTYNTLEAAQKALADFKAEYNENITEEIKENKTNTVLETINGTTAYNTFDAAQNALAEFLNNESNETTQFYFTGEVVGPKGTGEYTSSNINETFESSEKALEYLAKLEEEGYCIISYTFTKDTKKESNNLENTYNTLEAAQKALADFKAEYNEDVLESINKVHNVNKDNKVGFAQTFTTNQLAIDFLNEKLALNSEDVLVTGNITQNETAGEIVIIDEVFDSEEAATQRLAALENDYDVVTKNDIEKINVGTVYEALTITSDEKLYEIGSTTYILIKKGNDYYVWTQDELTEEAKAEFKKTYAKVATDKVITGDRINSDSTKFIYGNNTYSSSNGKLFTFIEENDKLYIEMASGAESRVVYGSFVPVDQYKLYAEVYNKIYSWDVKGEVVTKGYDYYVKASGSKTITLDSGTLTGSKKIENQGYYYNLQKKAKTYTVNASGSKTVTLESGTLTGSKKIENQGYYYNLQKKAKTYSVKVSGSKTITLESGTLKADTTEDVIEEFYALDLIKQKYTFVGGYGGGEEENPETKDESIWAFTIGGFSMIGLAATAYYLKKEEEK